MSLQVSTISIIMSYVCIYIYIYIHATARTEAIAVHCKGGFGRSPTAS